MKNSLRKIFSPLLRYFESGGIFIPGRIPLCPLYIDQDFTIGRYFPYSDFSSCGACVRNRRVFRQRSRCGENMEKQVSEWHCKLAIA